MTLLQFEYAPVTVPEEFVPEFDEGPHTYHWRKWLMPGVSHLLEATGIREPFDRDWYRGWLMDKTGCPEEHIEAEMAKAAIRGTEAHLSIGYRLMQQDLQLDRKLPEPEWGEPATNKEELGFYVMRAEQVLKDLEVSEVLMVEQTLVHPVGHFCGTIDALVKTPRGIMGLDWKTKASGKSTGNDKKNVYQLAAYLAAINNVCQGETLEDGSPVIATLAANAVISPERHKIYEYSTEEIVDAWNQLRGLLYDYWRFRVEDPDYHSPEMARTALLLINEHWGPFTEVGAD